MRAVVCPGHATYQAGDILADSSWVLQPFQAGEPRFYVEHIQRAVELAAADPLALLIFSGGKTRAAKSEAEGYQEIAELKGWFGHPEVQQRTVAEDYSRDSLENLLFSICRFRQHTGEFPDHVTVANWTFKDYRFQMHRAAIGWPSERFTYVGVNNPVKMASAIAGESQTIAQFERDPLARRHPLALKRAERNPLGRKHPFATTMKDLDVFLGTIQKVEGECSKDSQI